MHHPLAALFLIATAPPALAWGTLGHDTVALIAQQYVSSSTQSWAQRILDDTSSTYLASVATWADSYRYTSAGSFSAPFHYIDANDDPPSSCDVDYERDCPDEGCVVSAIANYVPSPPFLPSAARPELTRGHQCRRRARGTRACLPTRRSTRSASSSTLSATSTSRCTPRRSRLAATASPWPSAARRPTCTTSGTRTCPTPSWAARA